MIPSNQWEANRQRMTEAMGALATAWGVDAVGRESPRSTTNNDGYSSVRAGKWYVVRDGQRVSATSAQSRQLQSAGSGLSTYGSIGPIGR